MGGVSGELLAESLGTFVLICFGDGVATMAVAAFPGSSRAATDTTIFMAAGDWVLITWGWALAVVLGVYVAGGVTGAYLNPAVTLAFAVRRKFAWNMIDVRNMEVRDNLGPLMIGCARTWPSRRGRLLKI
ncbi:aquaporin [Arthrobacter alpinus]|nr:aquaporin [Arthrobacter alpinus]